jgi:hypothetical protein
VVKRLLVAIDGLGSSSVTWVLDELVAGDDIFDWVTPDGWERGRLIVLRPSERRPSAGSAPAGAFNREP